MKRLPFRAYRPSQSGFTLIELSIVLVIVALLVAGILVGRDMIEVAQMRKHFSKFQEVDAQVNVFRDKFKYLPGDFPNAVAILGSNLPNGNGNGWINSWPDGAAAWEFCRFWDHLSRSGIYKGELSCDPAGYAGAGSFWSPLSRSLPTSVGATYVSVSHVPVNPGSGIEIISDKDYLMISAESSSVPGEGFITAAQMLQFDTKYDDGKANTGKIRASVGNTAVTGNDCTGAARDYVNPSYPASPDCVMMYTLN